MKFLRRHRWWILCLIIGVSAAIVWAIQVRGWHITHPARDIRLTCGLINLFVYAWIRCCTDFSLTRQAVIVIALIAIQGVCVSLLRVDGYHGDGRLIMKWKWQPTPEQRLADFQRQSSSAIQSGSDAILSPESSEVRLPDFSIPQSTDSASFRGNDGSGRYQSPGLITDWDARPPKELWRRPVGQAWSSFAVANGFCVTQEIRDEQEAVVCYDLEDGREVWVQRVDEVFEEVTSGRGPRSTPSIHDGNVYALSSLGKLYCLRGVDGEPIWTRDLCVPDIKPNLFGFCGSPLIHGENVYVMLGGSHGSIVAVSRSTGDVQWKKGERRGSYSSPILFQQDGQTAVVIHDAVGLFAYDDITGERLCEFEWGRDSEEQINACQPAIVDEQHILLSSGYGVGSALVRIERQDDTQWSASEVWRTIQLKSKFQSIIVLDGFAYGLDEGILTCIDLKTGKRTWKKGRHRYGQLIMVNDVLVIQNEPGDVSVVAANPSKYEVIATIPALDDRTWSHPVIADGRLLVRNNREAVCFELPTSP